MSDSQDYKKAKPFPVAYQWDKYDGGYVLGDQYGLIFRGIHVEDEESAKLLVGAFNLLQEVYWQYSKYDDKVCPSDEWFGQLQDLLRVPPGYPIEED